MLKKSTRKIVTVEKRKNAVSKVDVDQKTYKNV